VNSVHLDTWRTADYVRDMNSNTQAGLVAEHNVVLTNDDIATEFVEGSNRPPASADQMEDINSMAKANEQNFQNN